MWILQDILGIINQRKFLNYLELQIQQAEEQQKAKAAAATAPAGTFLETPEGTFMEASTVLQLMPSTFMQMLLSHLVYTGGKQLYISGTQLYTNGKHLQQRLLNSDSADGLRQRFEDTRRSTADGEGQNSSFIEHVTSSKLAKYTTSISPEKRRKAGDTVAGEAGAVGEKGGDTKPAEGAAVGGDAKPAEGDAAGEEGKPAKNESPTEKIGDEVEEVEVGLEKVVNDVKLGGTIPGINDASGMASQILFDVHCPMTCWFACTYDPPLVINGYDEFLHGKTPIGGAAVGAPQTAYGTVVDSK